MFNEFGAMQLSAQLWHFFLSNLYIFPFLFELLELPTPEIGEGGN